MADLHELQTVSPGVVEQFIQKASLAGPLFDEYHQCALLQKDACPSVKDAAGSEQEDGQGEGIAKKEPVIPHCGDCLFAKEDQAHIRAYLQEQGYIPLNDWVISPKDKEILLTTPQGEEISINHDGTSLSKGQVILSNY